MEGLTEELLGDAVNGIPATALVKLAVRTIDR
jgi:hypothetical protein